MVSDDYYFLERWVGYYGGLFGKRSLHVVNHGGDPLIDKIASGCNVIHVNQPFDESFDAKRWRMLQKFAAGLLSYYDHVIVGDVDEFLVVDPETGMDLVDFMNKRKPVGVMTPVGLEVVHRTSVETDPIGDTIIGPRRYARYNSYFCKPCVAGRQIEISRGGHYSSDSKLRLFKKLYLFHMKFCDVELYQETFKRRKNLVTSLEAKPKDTMVSANWYKRKGMIDKLSDLPVKNQFDMSANIQEMEETWEKRGTSPYYHFRKKVEQELSPIPERFVGCV